MVINDLNIYRAGRSGRPFEAYPPLVIDTDAVLAFAVAFQRFKAVAGQHREIWMPWPLPDGQASGGGPLNAGKRFDPFAGSKVEGTPVPIADDHL